MSNLVSFDFVVFTCYPLCMLHSSYLEIGLSINTVFVYLCYFVKITVACVYLYIPV